MKNRRGLTIVELFVVLAIISVMLALFLPVVQSVRERARETVCKNNLHQLNLGMAQFAEVHKKLPASVPPGIVGGWTMELLPFLEQRNAKETVTMGSLISNIPAELYQPPLIFRCPRRSSLDSGSTQTLWPGHYVFVPTSRRQSFLLFDAPIGSQVPWVNGGEMSYDAVTKSKGPHLDGFFFTKGFQQGISFMVNGEEKH